MKGFLQYRSQKAHIRIRSSHYPKAHTGYRDVPSLIPDRQLIYPLSRAFVLNALAADVDYEGRMLGSVWRVEIGGWACRRPWLACLGSGRHGDGHGDSLELWAAVLAGTLGRWDALLAVSETESRGSRLEVRNTDVRAREMIRDDLAGEQLDAMKSLPHQ